MAFVKVKWRKDIAKNREMAAMDYEKYLLKERGTELVTSSHNCIPGMAIEQFQTTQELFGKDDPKGRKNVNLAFEVIHSFSPEQSRTLSTEKVNFMGNELAKRYFPDHQFMVVTHTDTDKTHNHILVNPVNERTRKRDITDKKMHLYNLRRISDEICLEHNLSIITPKEIEKKVPEKVRGIRSRGGQSYRLDLFQKADFARSYATSFDEYVGILNELSVRVGITDKTITYFYEGHEKGIRGGKLGHHYEKAGLIKKFKSNDGLFDKQPQLRHKIRDEIAQFRDGKGTNLGTRGPLLLDGKFTQGIGEKDYSAYTKSNRRGNRTPIPLDRNLAHSIVPTQAIREAARGDILDYCRRHKIAVKTDEKGRTVLASREFVSIERNRWQNSKNRTTGSLIEFVSLHKQQSYLRSIAEITGNKSLLLLEQYHGEVKCPYTPFYVPKEKRAKREIGRGRLQKFLKYYGINEKVGDDLFKAKRVQVDKRGSIWFYPENGGQEAVEFTPIQDNKYQRRQHGVGQAPFASPQKAQRKVTIYLDFLDFLKVQNRPQKTLVLMGLNQRCLHLFLAQNPNIKHLEIAISQDGKRQKEQWDFIQKIRKDVEWMDLEVNSFNLGRAMDRGRGPALGF